MSHTCSPRTSETEDGEYKVKLGYSGRQNQSPNKTEVSVTAHRYNHSPQGTEAGGKGVQGQPQQHSAHMHMSSGLYVCTFDHVCTDTSVRVHLCVCV